MPKLEDAVKLVTDPANVTRLERTGPQERFAVKQNRVLRGLRDAGAGKAEARELALKALDEVGGGAAAQTSRGAGPTGSRGQSEVEEWWVPADAIRF